MSFRGFNAKIWLVGVVSVAAMGLGLGLTVVGLKADIAQAQTRPSAPAPAPKNEPATSIPSQRTETVNYNAWVVTCSNVVGAASARSCMANLRVVAQNGQLILNWQIGIDKASKLVTVFQVPVGISIEKDGKGSGGILLEKGVELKLGKATVRRVNYLDCNAQFCEAVAPIDEALFKEASAADVTSITPYAADGTPIPFTVNASGMDKAIADVRSK